MAPTCLSGSRGFNAPHGSCGAANPNPALSKGGVLCFIGTMDKAEIRMCLRAERKRLNTAGPVEAIRLHAGDLPAGQVVALYSAIGAEVPTQGLAQALFEQGRTLCLPVVTRRDSPMVFRLWSIGDPLEDDAAGCPAPLELTAEVVPDLIVTPLVGFDRYGYRLGQGGGYYDRTFAVMPQALRIGLAFAGQEVERLPVEEHDIRLHGILTENGYRAFA